jgi:hypothetical protein
VLLPFRIRAYVRTKRPTQVRIRAFHLDAHGTGAPFMTFPWVDVGFVPSSVDLDTLAESGADAVVESLQEHEAALLGVVLLRAPLVAVASVRPHAGPLVQA